MSDSNQNSKTPVFSGEFRHKIEGKNRITVPAAWRFEEEVELFMIRKTHEKCISVMPRCELERIKGETNMMNPEDRAEFLHQFGRNVRQVTLDKGGRISIPDEFCKKLGIEHNVMLSGCLDTFRIWNVAEFEAAFPEDEERRARVLRKHGI
jgi:MraZ protein